MNFISIFSGIGGFDLGFEQAGMECKAQVEIDQNCLNMLTKHWPQVSKHTDVKEFGPNDIKEEINLICGGFPCQDISIAGNRVGLGGKRSSLFFEFARCVDLFRPKLFVIENVPGLLSSDEGRDFEEVISRLEEFGYIVAWRMLDAQYFGVAQRRRRVFIVGSLGTARCAEILFESQSMLRNPRKSKKAKEELASTIGRRIGKSHTELDGHGAYIYQWASGGGDDLKDTAQALRSGVEHSYQMVMRPTVGALQHRDFKGIGTTIDDKIIWHNKSQSSDVRVQGETSPTVSQYWGSGGNNTLMVGVRRLTPVECERLQGFPDDWTAGQSDSARYRQLGNAVAVPVARWIGKRIMKTENKAYPLILTL